MNDLRHTSLLERPENLENERRSGRRYDIALRVHWALLRRGRVMDSGTGTTVDLSSSGILIDTGKQLPYGAKIELTISWPVLFSDRAPMHLAVSGRIIRTTGSRAAIRMVQHTLRTVPMAAF